MERLQDVISGADAAVQWLLVMLFALIPYVESHGAAALGVFAGVPLVIAILAALVGNYLAIYIFVFFGEKISNLRRKKTKSQEISPRQLKVKRAFDKYGVVGVSFLGPIIVPSHLTSMAMVSFGVSKKQVLLWECIAVTAWGVGIALLAYYGYSALGY